MAARARSASLGRSKSLLKPARPRWSALNRRSSPLGLAGALDIAAQARARPRWSALNQHSSPIGLAGALDVAAQAHSEEECAKKLFENAVLWSQFTLNTWLGSSLLCAWICTDPPLVYIFFCTY